MSSCRKSCSGSDLCLPFVSSFELGFIIVFIIQIEVYSECRCGITEFLGRFTLSTNLPPKKPIVPSVISTLFLLAILHSYYCLLAILLSIICSHWLIHNNIQASWMQLLVWLKILSGHRSHCLDQNHQLLFWFRARHIKDQLHGTQSCVRISQLEFLFPVTPLKTTFELNGKTPLPESS